MKFGKELIEGILSPIGDAIDTLDTRDEKIQSLRDRWVKAFDGVIRLFEAQGRVVEAEAKSEHKLTSMWRPITMLAFVAIVVNNYMFAPYLEAMFAWSVVLEIPPRLWDIIAIGTGGYIASRGVEKIVDSATKNFTKLK